MADQASSSFALLDERIRRWIWSEQWQELRDVQEMAIAAILQDDADLIIAAATAAGKTEAAFLPLLSKILQEQNNGLVVYISPLKALINDQFSRLSRLCELLEIAVWPWHGDIPASRKAKFLKAPSGVLLITPESLEALLCNKGFSIPHLFANLRAIVVDELHAFIGSERGKQLQSLMQRVQAAKADKGTKIARIGLSATLGDMRLAAEFLRPLAGDAVKLLVSRDGGGELKIVLKGYLEAAPKPQHASTSESTAEASAENAGLAVYAIAQHLFQTLRGSNNLVFPNSRASVELYTYHLRKLTEAASAPQQFWPHHGNLSRELREETEQALKSKEQAATAICTSTLELGIDIGCVKSVAQIGPPPSVASLRQRLGRSGRRKGEPAILRAYVVEQELTEKSHPLTELREDLVQSCAMISLLIEGWFEPPKAGGLHFSTLVQQLLSLIAQRGGVSAGDAYQILCRAGPFVAVQSADFIALLRTLAEHDLIAQEASGILLHGAKGETLVNHYQFYAAFTSDEEYRVVSGSKTLGSLPISNALSIGDFILFAARTWRIEQIDEPAKAVYVSEHRTGRPPTFSSQSGQVHVRVRQRMREIYQSNAELGFVDASAKQLLQEGRQAYRRFNLAQQNLLQNGRLLFTWLGDDANEALRVMLRQRGIDCMVAGPAIEMLGPNMNEEKILDTLRELASQAMPSAEQLLAGAKNIQSEKWDWALPESQLMRSYASLKLDIAAAHRWLQEVAVRS